MRDHFRPEYSGDDAYCDEPRSLAEADRLLRAGFITPPRKPTRMPPGDDPRAGHPIPSLYSPAQHHVHRHAADLWATPLRDLREALGDLYRALMHVTWDHTLGRRHRDR